MLRNELNRATTFEYVSLQRYGGKWPFAIGICGAAIAGIVTPIAMMTGPVETMATQFVSGLFEVNSKPSIFTGSNKLNMR